MLYNQTNVIVVTGVTGLYFWWAQILNPIIFVILAILLGLLLRQMYMQRKGEKTINK